MLFGGHDDFSVPTDWTIKKPNMGSGAFNQLYQVINAITEERITIKEEISFVGPFCKDHTEGNLVPISNILNLEAMNEKYNFKFKDCLLYEYNKVLYYVPNGIMLTYWSKPEKFAQNCKCLIFSEILKDVAKNISIKRNIKDKIFNVVHIRFADNIYQDFLVTHNIISEGEEAVIHCRKAIYDNCEKDIPLFILVHDKQHPFIEELKKDYQVEFITISEYDEYLNEDLKNGRDIYAICDVLTTYNLKVKNFIYQENEKQTSSFSVFLKNTLNYEKSFNY